MAIISLSSLFLVVENMQLGKLEDCVQQYSILHNNLVALAHELDNIPTEDADAYLNIESFPDELYRQDPLDELLSLEDKNLPKLPLIPQCNLCHQQNVSFHIMEICFFIFTDV